MYKHLTTYESSTNPIEIIKVSSVSYMSMSFLLCKNGPTPYVIYCQSAPFSKWARYVVGLAYKQISLTRAVSREGERRTFTLHSPSDLHCVFCKER
jgi:hypothetical protein